MFRIGDFSRLARVSCRLLRYYDEIALLKPSATDSASGYRYYTAGQLGHLNRILVLRDLGFSLDEIARMVADDVAAEELRAMLLMRRREVARSIESEMERLRHIESRMAQIETEGRIGADDVILRTEPARAIIALREVIPSFAAARQLVSLLMQSVPRRHTRHSLGSLIGIAHSPEFEIDRIDLEIGFVLNGELHEEIALPDGRKMLRRELPAARVAACVRIGLPEQAHLITGKIAQFVAANHYRLAGPSRELFLQRPNLRRMDESVIEMQYPIAPEVDGFRSHTAGARAGALPGPACSVNS
jgi:DNA-binding transcriptional MerR regulator